MGRLGEVYVGQHRLPRCQGDWLGNSVLGAEWFSGHQCPEGLWVLLLLPSLEVSGTLDAQGSADAGDHGNVGGHRSCPSACKFHTRALVQLPPDSSGPLGFGEWPLSPACRLLLFESSAGVFPLNPGLEQAPSAPVLHSDMCSGSSSAARPPRWQ